VTGEERDAAIGLPSWMPVSATELFPFLEPATGLDEEMVRSQLGKQFQGEILVARRCPHSRPAVVLTLPLAGTGGPVPPLLWLTCPEASRMTGTLESSGGMAEVSSMLGSEESSTAALAGEDCRFADVAAEIARAVGGDELAGRAMDRGVAGGPPGAIKCLHAHLAYRLASSALPAGPSGCGPGEGRSPGQWCVEVLEQRGGPWCERPPAACIV
jgi:hypothetical protein